MPNPTLSFAALLTCSALLAGPVHAQAGPVVSIDGRGECEPRLYEDPPVPLERLVDTTALYAALGAYRRDAEEVWIGLQYAVTGDLLKVDYTTGRRSNAERAAISAKLAPLFHTIPGGLQAQNLAVVLDSGSVGGATLRPVDLTCPPALTNASQVQRAFQDGIKALRKAHALGKQDAGVVLVVFTVTREGRASAPRIQRSSGFPAADSAAAAAFASAIFKPAVAGRRAVPLPVSQVLRF